MQGTSFKLSGFLGALVMVAGCGSKTDPAPAGQQPPVEQKVVASSAVAASNATATVAKAPDEPVAKAAGDHAACGAHGGAQANEKDCPFDEEQKGAAAGHGEGCGHDKPAAAGPTKDGDALHYGQAFSIAETKPLATVLASAPAADSAVRVSGKIEKVCKKMGCWMVVKDGDKSARVVMKDKAFTVPLDSEGKSVNVEGTIKAKTFTAAQAKHLAEDGGEDPAKAQGEATEFVLTATAVNIGG